MKIVDFPASAFKAHVEIGEQPSLIDQEAMPRTMRLTINLQV